MKLKNSQIESFLIEKGFCKFDLDAKSLLSPLQELYLESCSENDEKKFYVTHNDGNYEKAIKVHNGIVEICEPIISKFWDNFEIFAAHFVVKKANSEKSFQLHQDWNNVEESSEQSVQIWIPLKFSYPENGGIGFFPRSHQFFNNYRSGSFQTTHVELQPELYPYIAYLRLFPGEAAFFYNSTFHCSFINSTEEDRIAVLINITPKSSKKIYCHKNGDYLEKYELTTSLLFENLHQLEKGILPNHFNLIERVPYSQQDNLSINAEQLIDKITQIRKAENLPADYEEKQYTIIRDKQIENEINHKGYTIINFLTENEIKNIESLFLEFFPDRTKYKGRYSSMEDLPAELTKKAHFAIQEVIKHRLELFFDDAYCPISLLYSKKPDGIQDIDWHSDPSFILNESLEPIYGMWCTLYDIQTENGSLMIVPGSHRFLNRLLGTDKTWPSPLKPYWRMLDEYSFQPSLKAGQALLYDARIVHSSSPNNSNINRDCIVMRITSNKTKDFFNIQMEDNSINKGSIYKYDKSYFFSNVVKSHFGKTESAKKEGEIYFFDYPVTSESVKNYFDKFKP